MRTTRRKLYNIYDEIMHKEYKNLTVDDVVGMTNVSKNYIYKAAANNILISNRYSIKGIWESSQDDNSLQSLLINWDKVCRGFQKYYGRRKGDGCVE